MLTLSQIVLADCVTMLALSPEVLALLAKGQRGEPQGTATPATRDSGVGDEGQRRQLRGTVTPVMRDSVQRLKGASRVNFALGTAQNMSI